MPPDDRNRSELARFLRSRRDRVTPADVGLFEGPRRKASGLRRAEVAVLAGLSTSWYTNLEQGRDVTPSRDVLDRLADVLQMTEDERRYMNVLAHGTADDGTAVTSRVAATELARDLVRLTDVSPYPVYACDEYFNLLAWNTVCQEWYGEWGHWAGDPPNLTRWLMTAPQARSRLVNWADIGQDVVARWRSKYGHRPTDPHVDRLNTELVRTSPEFATWWAEQEVLEHRSAERTFEHPALGRQTLRVVPVISPALANHGVIYHVPLDFGAAPTAGGAGTEVT